MAKLCTRIEAGPEYADPARVQQEAERRRDEEDRRAPVKLLPPEAFSNAEATPRDFQRLCQPGARTGRHAGAVHRRIMSSCAGWRRRPTAEEFYEAVRATRPTVRQQAIVDMWGGKRHSRSSARRGRNGRTPTAKWCGHSISPTSTAGTESARSTSGRRSTDTGHHRRTRLADGIRARRREPEAVRMTFTLDRYTRGVEEGWPAEDTYRWIVCQLPRSFHGRSAAEQRAALAVRVPLTGTKWDALLAAMARGVAARARAAGVGGRAGAVPRHHLGGGGHPWTRLYSVIFAPAAFLRHGAIPDPRDLDSRGGERFEWTPWP